MHRVDLLVLDRKSEFSLFVMSTSNTSQKRSIGDDVAFPMQEKGNTASHGYIAKRDRILDPTLSGTDYCPALKVKSMSSWSSIQSRVLERDCR